MAKYTISRWIVNRILEDIKNNVKYALPPATIRTQEQDERLKNYCGQLAAKHNADPQYYKSLLFTDEAVFPLRKGVMKMKTYATQPFQ